MAERSAHRAVCQIPEVSQLPPQVFRSLDHGKYGNVCQSSQNTLSLVTAVQVFLQSSAVAKGEIDGVALILNIGKPVC